MINHLWKPAIDDTPWGSEDIEDVASPCKTQDAGIRKPLLNRALTEPCDPSENSYPFTAEVGISPHVESSTKRGLIDVMGYIFRQIAVIPKSVIRWANGNPSQGPIQTTDGNDNPV